MTVKIAWLHLQNSTGLVDIELDPDAVGATVVGGKSGQGKTAILNNIAWTLGGDRYKPDKPQRDGAGYPDLDIKLTNGLRVTRKGKRSTLKVIDEDKKLGNQSSLNMFVGSFALDTSKFLRLNGKDKAAALLDIVPEVRDELKRLTTLHDDLYAEREAHGRVTTQKEKYAAELPLHKDTPVEETSASALIEEIRKVDAANAGYAKRRGQLAHDNDIIVDRNARLVELDDECRDDEKKQRELIAAVEQQLADARIKLADLEKDHEQRTTDAKSAIRILCGEYDTDKAIVEQLTDKPTDALQQQLKECEDTNARVRANAEKKAATAEGGRLRAQYATLTDKVEETRAAQVALLDNADLPLKPHLTVVHGELMYDGLPWDNLATSEQMKVAAAISSRENPNCGFLLADGLETMDVDTLTEFCGWAEGEDLQVIGTRVSVGDECTLIIQAGKVKGDA